MSCLGDGIQQKLQIHRKEIDSWNPQRSRNVGVTGLAVGPFCHYWYLYLDKWLPGRSFGIVMKKLIVDQFVCSPIVISGFLVVTSVLDGLNWAETKQEVIQKGKTLYKAEWLVWPPAQIINFFYLPTKYRVLFDNAVSFGFDWYFSYVKYGEHHKIDHDKTNKAVDPSQDFDPSMHFCGTGSHIPFVHLQAAKDMHFHRYVQLDHGNLEALNIPGGPESETGYKTPLDCCEISGNKLNKQS